jgi:pyruvate,water dikinase
MATEHLLVQLGDGDVARHVVGGKAATLSLLLGAGYRVPRGFVVTAAAHERSDPSLDASLAEAAARIGPGPYAVRSSATAEDLPAASYAGLYETYLDVDGEDLPEAVRRCFASASADRVSAYRAAQDAVSGNPGDVRPPGSPAMAVLVQQMVPAAAAGVAFSADPVTGERGKVVVTAVLGLGERLVSGEAIGEEWIIRGRQATCTRPGDGALTAAHAVQVAELACDLATRFGVPQDVEWAIDDQQNVHLLQTRPMTAVPEPVHWDPPGPGLWSRNFRLGEWLPEAMTPLFADVLLPRIEAGYLDGMRATAGVTVPFRYAAVNGWYYNATPIPSPLLLLRVLRDSRGRAPWFLYNALVRVSRDPAAADRALLSGLERQWREQLLPTYRELVDRAGRDLDDATPQRVLEIVDQVCTRAGEYLWYLAIVGGSAWKMEGALGTFWNEHLAGPLAGTSAGNGGPQLLLRALPGAEPAVPPHAVFSIDWYHPTAGEMAGVREVSAVPSPEPAAIRRASEAACRAALQDRPKLLAAFDELLEVAQRFAVIRERQARDLTLGWPLLRRCARSLGERFVAQDGISEAGDIFFLTGAELTDLSAGTHPDLGGVPQDRRALWARQCRLVAPLTLGRAPRLIGDPISRAVEAARSTHDLPEDAIIGHPASAGRATGRVRIVHGPGDFASFVDGEVLVAKATAPAWTVLFPRAAAVVTDGGTLAAHASLVAREYGIPAVVGTGDATAQLHTGQLVTVDGSAGTVQPTSSR